MGLLHHLFGNDLGAAGLIILNLILIESLLSIDNAAVLATMVMDLPQKQRGRALKYGILGAYLFRGICLVFAAWLIKFTWLKAAGGVYLVWLAVAHFLKKKTTDETVDQKKNLFFRYTVGLMGPFWATVVLIEIMDLAFSIDNVFAAVAFSSNIYIIWTGVFIGILAMRFVAQGFVHLMHRFPFLETAAFLVILILGLKLILSFVADFQKGTLFYEIINGHRTDFFFSLFTVGVFIVPVLWSLAFGKKSNTTHPNPIQ